ncbi:NAD(P)-dependent oxidoreductase [Neorhizobium sp. NCHU2750]|uniref:NAD-dependent epimerase/dehydratase family protein n=1 Tax=Neorhizobium sp. NCHU2750 TaxID=1825976 RepID=UPI000E737BE2|nr:NAD-dependent dehydratase [Neorhizobium sp. NCHU2750]
MLKRLLLTGAAGGVGRSIRPLLSQLAEHVVLSDIGQVTEVGPKENFVRCDLADAKSVAQLVDGVDGIIHLGGISVERGFEPILQGNIIGLYNLYEAARHHGKPRIVFASSNHVVGYYRCDEHLDNTVYPRPDSLYGVSKVFGEAVASMYHDKFGQETLSLRIGSCFERPLNKRMLSTWLSYRDFVSLCGRAFLTPKLGHTIVYGASANEKRWWDNSKADFLGWHPEDSSAQWSAEIYAASGPENPADPAVIYQGGAFAALGHPDDS